MAFEKVAASCLLIQCLLLATSCATKNNPISGPATSPPISAPVPAPTAVERLQQATANSKPAYKNPLIFFLKVGEKQFVSASYDSPFAMVQGEKRGEKWLCYELLETQPGKRLTITNTIGLPVECKYEFLDGGKLISDYATAPFTILLPASVTVIRVQLGAIIGWGT